jgi:indole-3-glycerol phosphate synthase
MILDDIVLARREDLARAKRETPIGRLAELPAYAEPRRPFVAALAARRPAVIAEVKKASPSRGVIRADFDPVAIARAYAEAGAAAISVLTEERFFQGSLDDLEAIRAAVPVPLLRKDFVVDVYQIVEARARGADAVLLIAAILGDAELRELLAAAREHGLGCLVEAHTESEVERSVAAGARAVGINNRDLRTFATSLAVCERLRPLVPADRVAVAESGIETASDIERLARAGFGAFLVGESLMRAPDPGAALRALLGEASGERGGRC